MESTSAPNDESYDDSITVQSTHNPVESTEQINSSSVSEQTDNEEQMMKSSISTIDEILDYQDNHTTRIKKNRASLLYQNE